MSDLDDFRNLLDSINNEWNRAEGDIKQAEQVCAKVIEPAINELRYAGRRLIDAISLTGKGTAPRGIESLLTDALFDCHRARHDAVDAATSKITLDLDILQTSLGIDVVLQAFPDFPALVREVDALREKIVASRKIRENRENIYTGIEAVDFPELVSRYNALRSSEPIMLRLAKRRRRERVGALAFGIIGIVGTVFTIISWLFPRSP